MPCPWDHMYAMLPFYSGRADFSFCYGIGAAAAAAWSVGHATRRRGREYEATRRKVAPCRGAARGGPDCRLAASPRGQGPARFWPWPRGLRPSGGHRLLYVVPPPAARRCTCTAAVRADVGGDVGRARLARVACVRLARRSPRRAAVPYNTSRNIWSRSDLS